MYICIYLYVLILYMHVTKMPLTTLNTSALANCTLRVAYFMAPRITFHHFAAVMSASRRKFMSLVYQQHSM